MKIYKMGNNLCACGMTREQNETLKDNIKIADISIEAEHHFVIINKNENHINIIDDYLTDF